MSTPNSELPTLASFSVLSTDTSWTLGEITCLQSDLPEYAQDFFFFLNVTVMMCEEVKSFASLGCR